MPHNKLFIINGNYINGKWVETQEKESVYNPANNSIITDISIINENLVNEAILAADEAQKNLGTTSLKDRRKILKQWAEKLLENKIIIAELITAEQGKILKEAKSEVEYAVNYVQFYANLTIEDLEQAIPANKIYNNRKVVAKPIGVCVAITPWNFPIAMYIRKFAAAFLAGCSMIIKPSILTPLAANYTVKLWNELQDKPMNALQIIHGNSAMIAKQSYDNFVVKKISFTGSTEVGREIVKGSANNFNKLSLELGGNAPLVIFEDAQMDTAIRMIIEGKLRNNGQSCVAINRVIIHNSLHDLLLKRLIKKLADLKIGDGADVNNDLGALINTSAVYNIINLVERACAEGAVLFWQHPAKLTQEGSFHPIQIITNVKRNNVIFNNEIFGPLIAIITFDNEKEALDLANKTNYGLASYICGENKERNKQFASKLEFGMVAINDAKISAADMPFGGFNHSGYGKEGHQMGLEEYLKYQYIAEK